MIRKKSTPMKKFHFSDFDLYMSEQGLTERQYNVKDGGMLELTVRREVEKVFHMPPIVEYISMWGKIMERERFAVLNAHGDILNGRWMYRDGKTGELARPVQGWINANDGSYSCLVISVCNPGSMTPTSKKSILAIPHSSIKFGESFGKNEAIFDLIVPGVGEINAYTIDYEVRKLRAQTHTS